MTRITKHQEFLNELTNMVIQSQPENLVVYLSGAMAGIKDNNFKVFNELAARWRERGYTIINPAENFGGSQRLSRSTYLKQDYNTLVQSCNAIALIEGWEQSVGASTEAMIAKSLGYTFYDAARPGVSMLSPIFKVSNPELNTRSKWVDEKPVESICVIADKLVNTDRQNVYGSPDKDFSRTAGVLNSLGFRFSSPRGGCEDLQASHIPIIMMGVKMSRLVNNENQFHRDSLIDIAGYAKTADIVHEKLFKKEKGEAD